MIHYASVLAEPFAKAHAEPLNRNPPKMRATLVSVLLACLMSTFVLPDAGAQQFEADLVIVNAQVRTMDASRPVAEAIVVHGGRIVAVGTSESVNKFRGAGTKVIDARGALVLPGFND